MQDLQRLPPIGASGAGDRNPAAGRGCTGRRGARWPGLIACLVAAVLLWPAAPAEAAGKVVTSQLGYAPRDPMSAVLAVPAGTAVVGTFKVVEAAGSAVVFTSLPEAAAPYPGGWIDSDKAGDTYLLDFTVAALPAGRYRIESNGNLSAPFTVGADVYDVRRLRPLEFFRIQRSGVAHSWTALDGASGWHGPDHLDDARQATGRDKGGGDANLIQQDSLALPGKHLDVAGGWSDAGDYNKYMGNTPWAAYLLLLSAEERPAYWLTVDDNQDGNPDLREVVKPALDWMLKMQHSDGSVYERVFNGYTARFDGRPDLETDNRSGTSDDRPLDTDRYADITAKAVYAWAAGYRVFGDPLYLEAARRAWDWALANPTRVKPRVYGGGLYFGDLEIGLTLGALELQRAQIQAGLTPDPRHLAYAAAHVGSHLDAADWTDPSSWDYQKSYALMRYVDLALETDRSRIVEQLKARWDAGLARQERNAYRFNDEWVYGDFGQNEQSASGAGDALWLYARTGERKYYEYAVRQLAWIFGRNPFGESWLASQHVSEYTRVPHWRATAKHPVEGVVVPGAADVNANGLPDYADSGEWFYSEPTINQQAMFVRVMAELFFASGGSVGPPQNLPPLVTILAPADGATLSGTITVSALASDASGVAGVQYRVDSGAGQAMTHTGPGASDPWQATLNTTTLPDGQHQLTVIATDSAGLASSPFVSVAVRNGAVPALHVERIDLALVKKGGSRYQARCDAFVYDAYGLPVAGAAVTGHWTGAAADTFTVTTDATGKATDYSNSSSAPSGATYTCNVDSIAKSGWVYAPEANRTTSKSVTVP